MFEGCDRTTNLSRHHHTITHHRRMEFLKGQDGIDSSNTDVIKSYMIGGTWSPATLKHYNAGVVTLLTFAREKGIPRSLLLPIDPSILYHFVVWAGPTPTEQPRPSGSPPIKSNTIRTYLSGVKAWNLFHDHDYPHKAAPRIEAILTAAQKLELKDEPKQKKNPVLIKILFNLVEQLADGGLENQVAYVVALVAFWGMARLGELVKASKSLDQVSVKDLIWDPKGSYLIIKIRAAKTAAVGEIQEIYLQTQPLLLDPVSAIRRLIKDTNATDDDPVFSYPKGNKRVTLTKTRCQRLFSDVWKSQTGCILTGHSFRVGGASLRWNLNSPLEEIIKVGRWKSKAYKLYIREYSKEDLLETLKILANLRFQN